MDIQNIEQKQEELYEVLSEIDAMSVTKEDEQQIELKKYHHEFNFFEKQGFKPQYQRVAATHDIDAESSIALFEEIASGDYSYEDKSLIEIIKDLNTAEACRKHFDNDYALDEIFQEKKKEILQDILMKEEFQYEINVLESFREDDPYYKGYNPRLSQDVLYETPLRGFPHDEFRIGVYDSEKNSLVMIKVSPGLYYGDFKDQFNQIIKDIASREDTHILRTTKEVDNYWKRPPEYTYYDISESKAVILEILERRDFCNEKIEKAVELIEELHKYNTDSKCVKIKDFAKEVTAELKSLEMKEVIELDVERQSLPHKEEYQER